MSLVKGVDYAVTQGTGTTKTTTPTQTAGTAGGSTGTPRAAAQSGQITGASLGTAGTSGGSGTASISGSTGLNGGLSSGSAGGVTYVDSTGERKTAVPATTDGTASTGTADAGSSQYLDSNGNTNYAALLKEGMMSGMSASEAQALLDARKLKTQTVEGYDQYKNDDFSALVEEYIARMQLQESYQQQYQQMQDSYTAMLEAQQTAQKAAVEQAVAQLNAQKDQLGQSYADLQRQLYIDQMNAQKNLPQQMAAMGYTGGMTESTAMGLVNSYADALRQSEQGRLSGLSELDRAITDARLNGDLSLSQIAAQAAMQQYDSYAALMESLRSQSNFNRQMAQSSADSAWNREFQERQAALAAQQWQQSFDYGKERDAVSDSRWQQSFDTSKDQWQQGFDYQKDRDAVSDSQWQQSFDTSKDQWQQSFDYQQGRDAVSDSQWQQSFDTSKDQWQQGFDYQKDRDAVSDSQWQQSFDTSKDQWQQSFDYEKERDEVSDSQWQQSFDADRADRAWDEDFDERQFSYQQAQDALDRAAAEAAAKSYAASSTSGGSSAPALTWPQTLAQIESGNLTPNVLAAYEYYMGAAYGSAGSGTTPTTPDWTQSAKSGTQDLVTVPGYGDLDYSDVERLEQLGYIELVGVDADGKPVYRRTSKKQTGDLDLVK